VLAGLYNDVCTIEPYPESAEQSRRQRLLAGTAPVHANGFSGWIVGQWVEPATTYDRGMASIEVGIWINAATGVAFFGSKR
jgi:hypothetical protein